MAASDSKMTLKLLIDAGNNKVLFAEAGKDLVDFIFGLLLLPLGSIIKLITPRNTIGSIGKLYQSFQNLKDSYLVANVSKSTLLQPAVSALHAASPLLLPGTVVTPQPDKTHQCPHCDNYFDYTSGDENAEATVEGFVKGVVTYMITDDLEITPMSEISSITLINRFSMKKDVQLEEKEVVVGINEGLALLEASLQSSTTLTDVFLNSSAKMAASSV